MKNIKNFNEFNSINEGLFKRKLPDFEKTAKVKKITIDISGDKVEALAGAYNGYSEERKENTFYFKTDKINAKLLKKHNISSVSAIDSNNNLIIFNTKNDEYLICDFKIKFFSKRNIGEYWEDAEDGYVAWHLSEDFDD